MFSILIVILLLTLIYFYGIKPLTFWREKGVQQENLKDAFLMNFIGLFSRVTLFDFINRLYKKFPGSRYYGVYQFYNPTLLLKDPDLIKELVIKDFEYFNQHRELVPSDVDPLFGRNLFSLKGTDWRNMRSTLSPSFTSSKMKAIFILMKEYSQTFINFYLTKNEDLIEVEMKDVTSRYCNDVIASTAFGTDINSFSNPNNIFFEYGKQITDLKKVSTVIKFLIILVFPKIAKIFKIKFFKNDVKEFFTKLVEDTIAIREEKGIVRPDMIQLLMEAQKRNDKTEDHVDDTGFASVDEHLQNSENRSITTEEIVAQALLFFFAGFDSVSSLMCFLAYELCCNPDIQNRLREEIEETYENCNGDLNYEALVRMSYMDMVVTEALRKWPTQVGIDRICTKPYVIAPSLPHEHEVNLSIGDSVSIPIYGIHRNPAYFPDPDKFDPERFNEDNQKNIKPYAFQPFGQGPRNCIGSRFALLETKTMLFYLLKHFKIVPINKTKIPMEFVKSTFSIMPQDGFWMGFKRI